MLLLTDGTVMAQEPNATAWWRLTPDEWGDYTHGTWSALARMTDARLYYASAVLAVGDAYGDDATMATNYPLVRLISEDARVHYCRTFDHSTMAVATGHRRVHTRFTVPAGLAHGRYDLRVVANGIASREVEVRVS